jgi:nitrite reductase/ring-hydroxylating ferredoxin subunit
MNSPVKIQPSNPAGRADPRSLTPSPLSSSPRWRTDFPINWKEDRSITRREFTSFLSLFSGVLLLTTSVVRVREWWRRRHPARLFAVRIAQVREVPIGGVKLFHYPTVNDPCLLVRLSADHFVAYSQKCTHLSCPVIYHTTAQEMHCPCHHGRFAIADGQVLAGPPPRSLPGILLARSGEEMWATGVRGE